MSSAPRRWSIGVIGAGKIVSDLHLPTLLAIPDFAVAWVADINAARARAVATAYGVPHLPTPSSLRDLPATDCVLVAIPYGVREPYYDALEGRAIGLYVEKPFARTVREHETLCARFPDAAISLGFQRRSMGTVRLLRSVLDADLFGPLRSVRVGHGTAGIVTAGTSYSSNLAVAGGGILLDVGIHWIDAALFVTNAVEVRVESGRMIRDGGFEIHTQAHGLLRRPDGATIPLEIVVSGLTDTIQGIECWFDDARVKLEAEGTTLKVMTRDNEAISELIDPRGSRMEPFQIAHAHWRGFLESLMERRPNWTSASQTLLTTHAMEQLFALGEG